MTPRQPHGFTLVELLVVVSIVALLIAILLPSLRQAREAARAAVCGSAMRQVSIGVINYTADFRGVLPVGHYEDARLFGSPSTYFQSVMAWRLIPQWTAWSKHRGLGFPKTSERSPIHCPSFEADVRSTTAGDIDQETRHSWGLLIARRVGNVWRGPFIDTYYTGGGSWNWDWWAAQGYWRILERFGSAAYLADATAFTIGYSDRNAPGRQHIGLRHPGSRANLAWLDGRVETRGTEDIDTLTQNQWDSLTTGLRF